MRMPVPKITVEGSLEAIHGEPGELVFVSISDLCVDLAYQRNMTSSSARLAGRIAQGFNWARFVPAIGVRTDDGKVALVDGQHRTAAAKARGIKKVPVYILNCTLAEAAGAFAAINGMRTRMSPEDIYRAELVAEVPNAVELQSAFDVAGVKVTSSREGMATGETRSIGPLRRALAIYGRDLLILCLQCITETGDGNAGLITGATVNGFAKALMAKPELMAAPSKVLDALDDFDLRTTFRAAEVEFAQSRNPTQYILTREINKVLAPLTARRAA